MSITPIDSRPGMGRSLVDHDPRNRNFPVSGVLFKEDAPLVEKVWRRGHAYDQNGTFQCVAYTGKGMLNTAPFSTQIPYEKRSEYEPADFYRGAQEYDEWPGIEPEYFGTSARGLLRYWTIIGMIKEYRWCFGLQDVLQTVSHHGPVSVGTYWHESMFEPDSDFMVEPNGDIAGGHQYQIIGIHPKDEQVECMNSWGTEWGDRGRFRMTYESLEYLLHEDGDAHTLVAI